MSFWISGLLALGGAFLLHVGCLILGDYIRGLPQGKREVVLSRLAKGYSFILAIAEIILVLGCVMLVVFTLILFPFAGSIALGLLTTYFIVVLKLCLVTRVQFVEAVRLSVAETWRALRFRK